MLKRLGIDGNECTTFVSECNIPLKHLLTVQTIKRKQLKKAMYCAWVDKVVVVFYE